MEELQKPVKPKRKLRKWKQFSLEAMLLLTTSIAGTQYLNYKMDSFQPEQFSDEKIEVAGKRVSYEHFYKNLVQKDGACYYKANDTTLINLNDESDYTVKGNLRNRMLKKLKASLQVDTVHISQDKEHNKVYYAYASHDSLPYMPAMGYETWGTVHVRYFTSDDPALAETYKVYNDEYNCTYRHEYQHFLNAGTGLTCCGQSYETKFSEVCMDEVSANIAQLLEQRKHYFETGGDLNRVTDRFKFYREWLITHPNVSAEQVSKDERAVIAQGVFDAWKQDKFPIYEERNVSIARHILSNSNYNGCVDNPDLHRQTMNEMFHINGMDFYQYIDGREKEFAEGLSEKSKFDLQALTLAKKNKMTYLEKVGQITQNDPQKKTQYFSAVKSQQEWKQIKKKMEKIKL